MLGLSPWVSFLAVFLAAALARAIPPRSGERITRALDSRLAALVAGVAGALLSWWVWGSLDQSAVMHDESAYLLQADLFAHGWWTGPGHSLPQFFEQLYVLVDHVTASKYPPGNSLVLAVGAFLGMPGLAVVLMNGVASALVFLLARRLNGAGVALLTCVIWQSSFPNLYYHASYMSEGVSSLAWLATWWGALRWHDGGSRRWLIVAATAAAWCIITRPLTGVALSLVALMAVVRHCRRSGSWRDLRPALTAAAAVLCVLPIWSWMTTGNPLVTPLAAYTRTYVPFDKPGFGARPEDRPATRLPHDQWITSAAFYQEHERHTLAALPITAEQRLTMIGRDAWYEWRGGLLAFAVIGLMALSAAGWTAVAAFVLQFGLYLSYAHPPGWTLYYLEGAPLLAFVTALGVVAMFDLLLAGSPLKSRLRMLTRMSGTQLIAAERSDGARTIVAATVLGLAGMAAGAVVSRQVRAQIRNDHAYYDAFRELIDRIPEPRAIVFVRYGAKHLDGLSLVRNVADVERAKVWTVYDRGAENARLTDMVPDRAAYLFDESTWTLRPVERSVPKAPAVATATTDSVRVRREARRLR